MEGPERQKLESKITRNPARRSEVESLVDESNILLDELRTKMVCASDWICQLCARFGSKVTWGYTTCAKNGWVIPIL